MRNLEEIDHDIGNKKDELNALFLERTEFVNKATQEEETPHPVRFNPDYSAEVRIKPVSTLEQAQAVQQSSFDNKSV